MHSLLHFHTINYSHQGGAGSSDDGDDDSDEDSGGQACELCGRTFPHEHVRAMYRGGGGDEDDDDESSDFGGV